SQTFCNTTFDIVDPKKNAGKSCIVLGNSRKPAFPLHAEAKQTNAPHGKWLYLLHALAWVDGNKLGTIVLTYADGTVTRHELLPHREAGNWWNPATCKNGYLAWTSTNQSAPVGLYRSVFPIQDKPLAAVAFDSANQSMWMIVAATVTDIRPPESMSIPLYVTKGKDWQPISYEKDVRKGSAMDLSRVLDAPAGKYGRMVSRGNSFEFENRPGVPLRFYGANICCSAAYLDKPSAERLADRFAAHGFNIARYHHHDNNRNRQNQMMSDDHDTTKLSPEGMDRLDYLTWCLKQRGIYITTDLHISRVPNVGSIPEYPQKFPRHHTFKPLFWLFDSAFENWKAHVRARLTHYNPYTKMTTKDDPALVSINVINEGNIMSTFRKDDPLIIQLRDQAFEKWAKERGLAFEGNARQANLERFMRWLYDRRWAQIKKFLREEIGLKCIISDQNMIQNPFHNQMRYVYDYVDTHSYSNHPKFLERPWNLPVIVRQVSTVTDPLCIPGQVGTSRLYGKGFSITEWDYCNPNKCRAEGPVLMGAYGGLQAWGLLCQFDYAKYEEEVTTTETFSGYFEIANDPVKHFAHRLGVALYHQVQPAKTAVATLIDTERVFPYSTPFPNGYGQLLQLVRVGSVVAPGKQLASNIPSDVKAIVELGLAPKEASKGLPVFQKDANEPFTDFCEKAVQAGILPRQCYDPKAGVYRSEDGAIELCRKAGTFHATTSGCEAFILPAKTAKDGNFLSIKRNSAFGVFGIIAVDGKPLAQTSRVLLLHITNAQPSLRKFRDQQMTILETWGQMPLLASAGEADLSLKLPGDGWKLYAIDTTGARVAPLSFQNTNGTIAFTAKVFNKFGSTFGYELVRE
ncbi:MAG: hypothetical protein IJJ26_09225, partial [Victivallales bacterium]|nr:hypothetical protein [Victivallales bacterium]